MTTSGRRTAADSNNVRTSLIVLPENGRLPSVQAGINHQPGGERDVAGTRPVRFAVGGIGRTGFRKIGVFPNAASLVLTTCRS